MRFWFTLLVCLIPQILTSSIGYTSQQFPALNRCADSRLQSELEQRIGELDLRDAVRRKQLCVTLVDISDANQPRLASLNGDQMMYAASLPKIAILLGAFQRAADGDMQLDAQTQLSLEKMIRHSSNRAATEMLNRVGKPYLAGLLQSPELKLYDPSRNGGLWVGKEYGKGPAWKRDPLHNLSHGATAYQVARFYYLLATEQLISKPSSRRMKKILGEPAIAHKFVKGLRKTGSNAQIYRKSGTWRQYHADSALIEHDGHTYIAVALASSPKGGQWLSDLIVALDEMVCR